MPWQSIPRSKTGYCGNRSFQIHVWPLYEEQIVKQYLNSTFSHPIVLLTIKSKLEDIYGLKGRQSYVGLWFSSGTWSFQTAGKSEPCDLCLLMQEQFPAIFPRLLSLLVLSPEAQAHYPQRYFNSCQPLHYTQGESLLPKPLPKSETLTGDVMIVVLLT